LARHLDARRISKSSGADHDYLAARRVDARRLSLAGGEMGLDLLRLHLGARSTISFADAGALISISGGSTHLRIETIRSVNDALG
jgi:hypothetical protein